MAAGLIAGALFTRGKVSKVALAVAAGSVLWRSMSKHVRPEEVESLERTEVTPVPEATPASWPTAPARPATSPIWTTETLAPVAQILVQEPAAQVAAVEEESELNWRAMAPISLSETASPALSPPSAPEWRDEPLHPALPITPAAAAPTEIQPPVWATGPLFRERAELQEPVTAPAALEQSAAPASTPLLPLAEFVIPSFPAVVEPSSPLPQEKVAEEPAYLRPMPFLLCEEEEHPVLPVPAASQPALVAEAAEAVQKSEPRLDVEERGAAWLLGMPPVTTSEQADSPEESSSGPMVAPAATKPIFSAPGADLPDIIEISSMTAPVPLPLEPEPVSALLLEEDFTTIQLPAEPEEIAASEEVAPAAEVADVQGLEQMVQQQPTGLLYRVLVQDPETVRRPVSGPLAAKSAPLAISEEPGAVAEAAPATAPVAAAATAPLETAEQLAEHLPHTLTPALQPLPESLAKLIPHMEANPIPEPATLLEKLRPLSSKPLLAPAASAEPAAVEAEPAPAFQLPPFELNSSQPAPVAPIPSIFQLVEERQRAKAEISEEFPAQSIDEKAPLQLRLKQTERQIGSKLPGLTPLRREEVAPESGMLTAVAADPSFAEAAFADDPANVSNIYDRPANSVKTAPVRLVPRAPASAEDGSKKQWLGWWK
jgi:hypothetical protein